MIDKIIAYETGELNNQGILELFSELIKTKRACGLAMTMLNARLICDNYYKRRNE